jgi:hypothetical protein
MNTLTSTYIFNQYYIDLLKKLKNIAKKHKTKSETAKRVLKTIKDNYQTYDKTSSEYIDYFKEKCSSEFWASYVALEKETCDEWFKDDTKTSVEIYKNISIKDVIKLLRNNFISHHYLSVLYIYTNELSEEQITLILKNLQSVSDEKETEKETENETEIENADIKKVLSRLNELKIDNFKSNSSFSGMDSLRDTTIGKIAKEIIDDVDLTKIKETIASEGNIFTAISKPDSGFGELFTNVSQKMSNKISSGELSQEAIMKDAMKFASLLPGLFGGGANPDDNSNSSSGFDMSTMMNMMAMMNSGGGGGGGGGGRGGGGGGGNKHKTGVNNQGLRNLLKKQQLKQKLNN